jgi:AcrR family transcriptional regulator
VSRVVVGKRQFDEGVVVDRAVEVFWRQGYAATSIDDLVRATGLGRGSLYGAFGNKTELFLRAVEHDRMKVGQLLTPPSGLEPRQAIQAIFDRIVDTNLSEDFPAGCLLTKACTEFATLPAEAHEHVLAGLAHMEERFRAILGEAKGRGQLATAVDVDQLARFFVGVHLSLAVLAAAGASREVLSGIVGVSLAVWTSDGDVSGSRPVRQRRAGLR